MGVINIPTYQHRYYSFVGHPSYGEQLRKLQKSGSPLGRYVCRLNFRATFINMIRVDKKHGRGMTGDIEVRYNCAPQTKKYGLRIECALRGKSNVVNEQ
jgi:hypothetical protein